MNALRLPILLAALVISTEYGNVVRSRAVLSTAVSDATRYLSRMPYDEATNSFPSNSVTIAEEIIRERMGGETVNIVGPTTSTQAGFLTVKMTARSLARAPALAVLNIGRADTTLYNGIDLSEGVPISAEEIARVFRR